MIDRSQVAASAAGSLRLEGLEPSRSALALAELWVRGEASDADLREAERRVLSGQSLESLLPPAPAVGASQHV